MTEKQVLLVIDMQADFCVPGGPLFVAGAPDVVDNVRNAVDAARAKAVPIVWVVREHHPSGECGSVLAGGGRETGASINARANQSLPPLCPQASTPKSRAPAFTATALGP